MPTPARFRPGPRGRRLRDPAAQNHALVGLTRERNRLVHALETACEIAEAVR